MGSAAQLSVGVALKKRALMGSTFVAAAVARAAPRRAREGAESTRDVTRVAAAEFLTGTAAESTADGLPVRAGGRAGLGLRTLAGAR
jgi:hypothetical protein